MTLAAALAFAQVATSPLPPIPPEAEALASPAATNAVAQAAQPGAEPASASPSELSSVKITSGRACGDLKASVLMYDRDVFVDAGAYQLRSDQLYVFLDPAKTNDFKKIVALGNVRIRLEAGSLGEVVAGGKGKAEPGDGSKKERRRTVVNGVCAKATYTKAKNRIVLYGDGDDAPAKLESDDPKQKMSLAGSSITYWVDSQQFEVEDSRVEAEAGSLGGKGGLKKALLGK